MSKAQEILDKLILSEVDGEERRVFLFIRNQKMCRKPENLKDVEPYKIKLTDIENAASNGEGSSYIESYEWTDVFKQDPRKTLVQDFKKKMPIVFFLEMSKDGKRTGDYVVNTEGAGYPRYMAKIV